MLSILLTAGHQVQWTEELISLYLIVELEDNTPDATPPSVESDAHYTGLTSYVEGARTLYLSLMDTNNLIDTSSLNGPKLHYSTDGGNTYTIVAADSLNTCASKNTVCMFGADTSELSAGTTVVQFWTYTDTAAYDNSKIPPQTPNPGRFPAAGAADLTFTIGDVYQSSGQKLVTLFEDISGPDTGGFYTSRGWHDRQVTYYGETGEFLFEFDFSECGYPSTSSGWMEDQCFWDADVHPYDDSYGHWDINWEGVANDCYPGATGCTGAPANTLELDSYFGGIVDVDMQGTDNLLFTYDELNGEWMVSAVSSSGIDNKLSTSMNDVIAQSYTPNMFTPTVTINTLYEDSSSQRYYHPNNWGTTGPTYGFITQVTVPQGDIGRIVYTCGSYCGEQQLDVTDTNGNFLYTMGYSVSPFPSNGATYISNVDTT